MCILYSNYCIIFIILSLLFFQYQTLEDDAKNKDSASFDLIQNGISPIYFINQKPLVNFVRENNGIKYLRKRQADKERKQNKHKSAEIKNNRKQVKVKKSPARKLSGKRPPVPRPPMRKPGPRRTTARRPPARRTPPRRPPPRRTTARRPPARRTPPRRPPPRRTTVRRPPVRRTSPRRPPPRRTTVRRPPARRTPPRRPPPRRTTAQRPPVRRTPNPRPPNKRPPTKKPGPILPPPKPSTSKPTTTTTTTLKSDKYTALNTKAISEINNLRRKHQTPDLIYDKNLADRAQEIADKSGNGFHGIDDQTTGMVFYIARSEKNFDPLSEWTSGTQDIDYDNLSEDTVPYEFAQILWVSTEKIGCGTSELERKDGIVTVCLLSPKGNIPGQYQNNIRRPIQ
uniref:SCP domain-containing protein n=1 Tax=Strongyloides venezuelensis TaxID=75913 RepID=A0A0K0FJ59_STRVS